jgi:hypothetical protein
VVLFIGKDQLRWYEGRARVDLVETASALDVFVSSLQLELPHHPMIPQVLFAPYCKIDSKLVVSQRVRLRVAFLGIMSHLSDRIDIIQSSSIQTAAFAARKSRIVTLSGVIRDEIIARVFKY